MSISEISIKRPIFAWMLMSALILFGAVSFLRMGISQLPDVDFPVVRINMRLEGAAPEVIETEVTDFVENAVMGVEGVRNVTSRSENSETTVVVEFELQRNINQAVQDIQAKLSQIQSKLPREISDITVSKTNPEDQPIIVLSLQSEKYPLPYLMSFVRDRLKDQFAMIPGVGDITLGGYVDPNLRIWISPEKLRKYELTVNDIAATVQNEHSEQPAGKLENAGGNEMYFLRTMGEAVTVKQFEDLQIKQRGGKTNYANITLGQVSRIEEGVADILGYSRVMGQPGISINILKQRGTNAVDVAKGIRAKMGDIQKNLPEGMQLGVSFDSAKYIEQAVGELNFTLLMSAILTALVCWLFLGSWSSTLNVLFAIPTSVLGTFICLYFCGFTLNTFTLLGLSLSIGIVVDDAIMVLENIVRHKEMGKGKVRASLDGSKEITFAAMAATISIVAIFLPVVFMTGIIGKYFFQFGVTITVAVLLSLLEALTLTPMRSSQFVDSGERHTRLGRAIEFSIEKTTSFYQVTLKKIIKHPWSVLSASILFFAASMFALNFVNKEFIPSEDQSRFNIRMKTKLGTSLMSSDRQFREVEKFLASRPEISRYVVQVGGGSPGDANNGSVLVTMKDVGQRGIDKEAGHELSQLEFMDLSRKELKKIKGVKVVIQDPSARSFSAGKSFPVEFTIQGPDWDQLAKYSDQMMGELEKTDLVTDLDSDYQSSMPEIQVVPDRKSAAEYGVSILNISQTINATIGGAIIGQYPKDGHRNDIRLKLEDKSEDPYDKIKNLYIRNYNDELVPLAKLVKFEKKTSMLEISRRNRERAITIDANVKSGKSQQEALTAVQNIAKKMLDPKYHVELSGSSNSFNESFQSLILALILGLAVAYMVLASQFNSLTHPLAVLIALPFSVSGAFVALWLSHKSLNIYSMIGLILLMGIVKKNSILLVDFTNQVKAAKKSLSVVDALLEACPIRLRPILMTSVATIAGAVPAALALGPGAESRIPMAISVIGGVIVSTVLTLYVVPCAYLLMWREPKVVEEDHH